MRSVLACYSLVALVSLASGCSSDREAIEKQLSSLRDDIRRLQKDNDRFAGRLDTLEAATSRAAAAPRDPGEETAANRLERPPLRVVKMVPEAAREAGAVDVAPEELPDAPGPRPVIRLRGTKDSASESLAKKAAEEK